MIFKFMLALLFGSYTHIIALNSNSASHQYSSIHQTTSLKQKIKGVWTDGETDNAAFVINDKTIHYVDNDETYKYRLSANKMTIYYAHYNHTFKIDVKNDTLTMYSKAYGLSTYWRMKE